MFSNRLRTSTNCCRLKRRGVRNDKDEYLARGAIPLPPDGIKIPGQKCLPCISQQSKCHGNDVVDGKCRSCRGISQTTDEDGNIKTKNKRDCHWVEEDKGIWTWEDAQDYYGLTRAIHNTREGVIERQAGRRLMGIDNEEANDVDNSGEPGVFDMMQDTKEYEILRHLAKKMLRDQLCDDALLNIKRFRQLTITEHTITFLEDGSSSIHTRRERRHLITNVFTRLDGMLIRREGITAEQIWMIAH